VRTGFLFNRCLTIAGGTSEVRRNVIAERLLGPAGGPVRIVEFREISVE
jgi:hypothetical protein